MKNILRLKELVFEFSEGLRKSKKIIIFWDLIYIGVIGLNSYILLIYNNRQERKLIYVICAAATSYVTVLIILLVKLRKHKKRREILYFTRKIFRLIYTAVYLTIIMLHIIRIDSFKTTSCDQIAVNIYNAVMFLLIAIIGTSSFWWKKLLNMILKVTTK